MLQRFTKHKSSAASATPPYPASALVFALESPVCPCALFASWGCRYSFTDHFTALEAGRAFVTGRASQMANHFLRDVLCRACGRCGRGTVRDPPTNIRSSRMVTRPSCSCHGSEVCYFHKTLESESCRTRKMKLLSVTEALFLTSTQNHGEIAPPSVLHTAQRFLGLAGSCISALSQEEEISVWTPAGTCLPRMLLHNVFKKQERALILWREKLQSAAGLVQIQFQGSYL